MRTLSFGSDLNYSAREDAPVGPFLQNMPSEQIRNQLTAMSCVLSKAVAGIKPAHILVSVGFERSWADARFESVFLCVCAKLT